MSFAHIPAEAHSEPRLFDAGMGAVGVRFLCWAYSSQHRTGGFVRDDYVRSLPKRDVAAAEKASLLQAAAEGQVFRVEGRTKRDGRKERDVEVVAPWLGFYLPEYLLYHRTAGEEVARSNQQRDNALSRFKPDQTEAADEPTAEPVARPTAEPNAEPLVEPMAEQVASHWSSPSTSTSASKEELALTEGLKLEEAGARESEVGATPGTRRELPSGWQDAVRAAHAAGATPESILTAYDTDLTRSDVEYALAIGIYAPGYTEGLVDVVLGKNGNAEASPSASPPTASSRSVPGPAREGTQR